jgi:hypothetical protein
MECETCKDKGNSGEKKRGSRINRNKKWVVKRER